MIFPEHSIVPVNAVGPTVVYVVESVASGQWPALDC